MHPVHVRCTRKHRDAVIPIRVITAVEVCRVEVVHDWVCDLNVHAAELVDEVDEAVEAYPHVVVDVDFEVALDRAHRRLGAAELVGRADLADALAWDGHPEVTRYRQHGGL